MINWHHRQRKFVHRSEILFGYFLVKKSAIFVRTNISFKMFQDLQSLSKSFLSLEASSSWRRRVWIAEEESCWECLKGKNKSNTRFILGRCGGGGQVVILLAFHSDDSSLNHAVVYSFYAGKLVEKNEKTQKAAGESVWPDKSCPKMISLEKW